MLSLFFKNSFSLVKYSLAGTILTISGDGAIDQKGVRSKGDFQTFTDVIINEGPSSIEFSAFYECRKLKYVKIPASITRIEGAFGRNECLERFDVAESNSHILLDEKGVLYSENYEKIIRVPNINNFTIQKGAKTIGSHAFNTERRFDYGNIVLPSTIEKIDTLALNEARFTSLSFAKNSKLQYFDQLIWANIDILRLPNSITSINSSAFEFSIVDLIVFEPVSKLATIETLAFENLVISKIALPPSVQTINNGAFKSSTVKEISIGSLCSVINESAFTACQNLQTIIIDPQNAHFSSNDGILMNKQGTEILFIPPSKTTITISKDIKSIAKTTIQACSKMREIKLDTGANWDTENGVLYTKNFKTLVAICGGIESVTANSQTTVIKEYAAFSCSNLILFSFGEASIVSIGIAAFSHSKITSFSLPSGVKSIGESAFEATNQLINFDIPESSTLDAISTLTFSESSIGSIYIPQFVRFIGYKAFRSCKITSISFHTSCQLTELNSLSFYCCILESVCFPKKITKILDRAFEGCKHLQTVTFENGVDIKAIEDKAFFDCIKLRKVVLPESCKTIGQGCFANCEILTEFTNSLTTIGVSAFSNCKSLENFNFSITQTVPDPSVFKGCEKLKAYHVERGNPLIKDAYGVVFNLEETTLYLFPPGEEEAIISTTTKTFADNAFAWSPCLRLVGFYSGSQLETIGNSVFYECKKLTNVQYPSNLKTIKSNSFYGCESLRSIVFPPSLATIEEKAFDGCNSLKRITYCGTNSITTNDVFSTNADVYVTDLYPSDKFCSLEAKKLLEVDCELKIKEEKTCLCFRYNFRWSTFILAIIFVK